jgi:hypothetical protein
VAEEAAGLRGLIAELRSEIETTIKRLKA